MQICVFHLSFFLCRVFILFCYSKKLTIRQRRDGVRITNDYADTCFSRFSRIISQNRFSLFQGWDFAHLSSEQIARFWSKKERMSDSLQKMSDSSFAHFLWAKWAIRSHRSFHLSDLSESLMVAHFWWAKWAIRSHGSFDLSIVGHNGS